MGVVLLAGLVMRVLVVLHSSPLDDAYITFRYARNLSAGLGFVYNAGERVLGTTTPLWTLILTPIASLGLPLDIAGVVLGSLLDLLVLGVLWRLLDTHVSRGIAFVTACFYATFYANVAACGYGMETQLFMLLLLLSFKGALENRFFLASGCAAAATLIRPEGLLLVGMLLLAILGNTLHRKRFALPWKAALLYLGILALWCLPATRYFGSPLPNSILAKMHIPGAGPADWLEFFFLRNPLVIFLWAFAGIGTSTAIRSRNSLLLLFSSWTVLYVLFFLLGNPAFFASWYFPPLAVALLPLAATAADFVARPVIRGVRPRAWTLGLSWMLLMALLFPRTLQSPRAIKQAAERVYRPLAAWMHQAARPEDVVFAGDIGYLGYFSQRHLLDSAALVSPEVWKYYARHEEDPLRDVHFILESRPAFVVVSMGFGAYGQLTRSSFCDAYVPVKRFSLRGDTELRPQEDPALSYQRSSGLIADYLVFRRQ